jgi:hypothetical protein
MLKGKFTALSLVAAAALCWQVAGVSNVNSGIVDPCNSDAVLNGYVPAGSSTGAVAFGCPVGDGEDLGAVTGLAPAGLNILVTVRDNTNAVVPGVPAEDFWLVGCNDLLVLCNNTLSVNADAATNGLGQTFIRFTPLAVGGCDAGGVRVVCQGAVIGGGVCGDPCIPLKIANPDQKNPGGGGADLQVTAADFSFFAGLFVPAGYQPCIDMVVSGTKSANDFTKFSSHFYGPGGAGVHHCNQ